MGFVNVFNENDELDENLGEKVLISLGVIEKQEA
jgi:hypothetical protein